MNPITGTNSGIGEQEIKISPDFQYNRITLNGIATGTATIRCKSYLSTEIETVDGGVIDFDAGYKTAIIERADIQSIYITVSAAASYDYIVSQKNLREN